MSNQVIEKRSAGSILREQLAGLQDLLTSEAALVILLVIIGAFTFGYNLSYYPSSFRNQDEGVYTSQAWSVLTQGKLSPYTYFYDHAPAGWILLAVWTGLTGGPFSFGTALDGGRVFMLVLHMIDIPLLYSVSRKLGAPVILAAFGVLIFSLSPLSITFGRMVLLDNMMVFWLLLSINLLLDGYGRLSHIVLSGMAFGIAILTKETAFFLLPAMAFLAWNQRWRHQGHFGLVAWGLPMIMIFSLYPLYASLKGELIPAGFSITSAIFSSTPNASAFTPNGNVSLIESIKWQLSRKGGGGIFNPGSMFWQMLTTSVLALDPVLTVVGPIVVLINFVRGFWDRRVMAAALLGLLPLLFLAHGGLVYDFYVLFALPFICLNLALVLVPLYEKIVGLNRITRSRQLMAAGVVLLILVYYMGFNVLSGRETTLYLYKPDIPVRQALAWSKANLNPKSSIVVGDTLLVDFRQSGLGGPAFPNAQAQEKVASDPSVKFGVFKNDWRNIDYLLMTPDLKPAMQQMNNTVALQALQHATVIQTWSFEDVTVELYKVNNGKASSANPLTVANTPVAQHH